MSEPDTTESAALASFLKTVTPEQEQKAFGDGGIFTKDQVELFRGVAAKRVPASRLDDLLPSGPLAIDMNQMLKAQGVFNMMQLFPLATLIQGRVAKRSKSVSF